MKDSEKEFKPTSWAIDNKVSIYVATVIICLAGIMTYVSRPKESFPEVVFPQIFVATIYPGASPKDVENLVTKEIEKQVKSIAGVKKVISNSVQDFSNVIIEFETDIEVDKAKQDVKDAVDRAKPSLPSTLFDSMDAIGAAFASPQGQAALGNSLSPKLRFVHCFPLVPKLGTRGKILSPK